MSEEKKLSAKLEQVGGAIKEGFGKLTGDKELEAEGATDQVKGKVEETIEKAKEVVENVKDTISDTVSGIKNSLNKEDKE